MKKSRFREEQIIGILKQGEAGMKTGDDKVGYFVRRAKARFSSGCESRPAAFAPAGSNRSSRGGNEAAEASGVEGHYVTWRVCRP